MIWLSYGRVSLEFFRKGFGGPPLLEVHHSLAHTEYMRRPIFIPSCLFVPVAHAHTSTHRHAHTYKHAQT